MVNPPASTVAGLLQKVCDVLKTRAELERKYGESLLSLGESDGPEKGPDMFHSLSYLSFDTNNSSKPFNQT